MNGSVGKPFCRIVSLLVGSMLFSELQALYKMDRNNKDHFAGNSTVDCDF